MKPPLYLVCKRPGCGQLRHVARPWQQRKGGYCSHRCASIGTGNVKHMNPSAGGRMTAHRKRLALVARVKDLSPLDAFRLGYQRGLSSKTRQLAKRVRSAAEGESPR
jgi:hypothetical protein